MSALPDDVAPDSDVSQVKVTQTGIELLPDHARTIAHFFVAGREGVGPGDSRATQVIDRILDMDESSVVDKMLEIEAEFSSRHRNLNDYFEEHADMVMSRVDPDVHISTARKHLIGASFTNEFSIEGAAICNPSAVLHPQQDDSGDANFVMSVRGIGEGHISSIGFRTGKVTASGNVTLDPAGSFPATAYGIPGTHQKSVFHAKMDELGDDLENTSFVLNELTVQFDTTELEIQIELLAADFATRRQTFSTLLNLRLLAKASYRIEFPSNSILSERVLWPQAPIEKRGMEDARFVRFVSDEGEITYYATYTAFDGINISQQLLETKDFKAFTCSPMAGSAASGKGLALFPRKINGHYVALSRSDRETNAIAFSDDLFFWNESTPVQVPEQSWETLQLGNCGSPIEIDAGWLVLTHGVGPMRKYVIGAILLDLDDPQRVLARLTRPLLAASQNQREGYVPNVVYSCGGFVHNGTLILPYGIADQSISIATVSIDYLVESMTYER
ncbi:MAG TPA: glycoside hydrolase family 130 protein [Candidatus Nanopelagicaceae bacterium]|nr:glycoside hydrolase family 130 protein [Candidatus Nanopelagicaceae bacterium]